MVKGTLGSANREEGEQGKFLSFLQISQVGNDSNHPDEPTSLPICTGLGRQPGATTKQDRRKLYGLLVSPSGKWV